MARVPNPGLRAQPGVRIALRIGGFISLIAGASLIIAWVASFGRSMLGITDMASRATQIQDPSDLPGVFGDGFGSAFGSLNNIWMLIAGTILISAGAWMLKAGFLGAATRYVAGEVTPVIKDSAAYLTDGAGIMNIGRVAEDSATDTPPSQVIFCQKCGSQNSLSAKFCSSCGKPIAL